MNKRFLVMIFLISLSISIYSQVQSVSRFKYLFIDYTNNTVSINDGTTQKVVFNIDNKNISNIVFDCFNSNIIYYCVNDTNKSNIFKLLLDGSEPKIIYSTESRISQFIVNNDEIILIEKDIKYTNDTNPRLLYSYNINLMEKKVIYYTTEKNEYLTNLALNNSDILFCIKGFGYNKFVRFDMTNYQLYFYDIVAANIFSKENVPIILIEEMLLEDHGFSSYEEYDGKLSLLSNVFDPVSLNLKYERMGGKPIIINDHLVLLPRERNIILNQLKSFPFGFQNKDIKYQIYDINMHKYIRTILNTNTRKIEITDIVAF